MGHRQSRMLQVVGILLIIWSVILVGRGLLVMDVVWGPPICPCCAPSRAADAALLEGIGMELWPFILLLFLLGSAATLIAGIVGVLNWKKPHNANRCFIGGITAVVIYLCIFGVMGISTTRVGALTVYALYIVGAYRLKRLGGES